MLATEQVTTLFVHGAWHQPAHFVPIMAKLESNGMHCICPQQPTYNVSSQDMRTTTMYKDASAIRKVLDELIIEQERYVMVVLHSYGGLVGTQATDASLGVKQRASQGKMGGVVRLVYMCAFLMAPNTSLGDAFGGRLPPFIKEEEDGSCNMIDPRQFFYSGLDDATAKYWLTYTRPHPAIAQLTPLTYTAYLYHPTSYIVSTEDAALPPVFQRAMVQQCKDRGAQVDVHEIPSDHSPYLSREAEMMAILQKLAKDSI